MTVMAFERTIDKLQTGLVWFVIAVITICIGVLFLFDVLAGTGTMLYLTSGLEWQSVVISLATTGLLFALMFIGYMLVENKNSVIKMVGAGVVAVAGSIYIQDIVFDALLADILRYGTIAGLDVDKLQWMFRFLLGGISTIGDALALAMILGMPVLKKILKNTLQTDVFNDEPSTNSHHYNNPPAYSVKKPANIRRDELRKKYAKDVDMSDNKDIVIPKPVRSYHP